MCTAISLKTTDHYFGRNLDLNYSFNEAVTVMPRHFPLHFRCTSTIHQHYSMIGMATIDSNYPLFYDAVNEYGLCIAALNFPDNAKYWPTSDSAVNIAPYEVIPWLLCQCKNVKEAKDILSNARIVDIPYSEQYSLTPLHWIISDASSSVVVEQLNDKLMIHDNPIGVLTNNPPFPFHSENLRQYIHLSSDEPTASWILSNPTSNGTGAIGLPGDASSISRFIRAAFNKQNASFNDSSSDSIIQFFHILQSVQQIKGTVRSNGQEHFTIYSSCCNATKGHYYYTSYENSQIHCVDMHREDLNEKTLFFYPICRQTNFSFRN